MTMSGRNKLVIFGIIAIVLELIFFGVCARTSFVYAEAMSTNALAYQQLLITGESAAVTGVQQQEAEQYKTGFTKALLTMLMQLLLYSIMFQSIQWIIAGRAAGHKVKIIRGILILAISQTLMLILGAAILIWSGTSIMTLNGLQMGTSTIIGYGILAGAILLLLYIAHLWIVQRAWVGNMTKNNKRIIITAACSVIFIILYVQIIGVNSTKLLVLATIIAILRAISRIQLVSIAVPVKDTLLEK